MSDAPVGVQHFAGSRLKITRASKHLTEVEAAIADFIAANPMIIEVSYPDEIAHPVTGQSMQPYFKITGLTEFPAAPAEIGPMIGDVVHNLRSSLDIMACELARLNGESDRRVYFPFCETPEYLDKMIDDKNFNRCGDAAVALLKSFAPHKGNIVFRALHDLDVQDKHQCLIPTATMAISPTINMIDRLAGKPLEPVTETSFLWVAFPNGSFLSNKPIVPALQELVDLTTSVIEAFALLVAHRGSGSE